MARLCLECGDSFYGRSDKKFCQDQCRSAYNNRMNSDVINFVRKVNNVLSRNRRILQNLNPEGHTKTHRNTLLLKGFMFSYFTNQVVTRSGRVCKFCYDQGYLELSDDYFVLIKKEEVIV